MKNSLKLLDGNYEYKVKETRFKYGKTIFAILICLALFSLVFFPSFSIIIAIGPIAYLLSFLISKPDKDKYSSIVKNKIGELHFMAT